jgi:hypothetical protein
VSTIYIASKTVHAPRWRTLRAQGLPIISTWIDEAGFGETVSFVDLWRRCVEEAAGAACLIAYREPGEVLKGGLVEIGAALGAKRPVFLVGFDESNFSFKHHPFAFTCDFADAVTRALLVAKVAA